jgi:tRNA threonylcarbamoyladenosine biosynthesis protein TsaB
MPAGLPDMPNLLALDAITPLVAVGLRHADGKFFTKTQTRAPGGTEPLAGLITALLAEAGLSPPALGGIVAVAGPGSFTGLRVTLAAAQGLGLALRVPVMGISVLALYAQALSATSGAPNQIGVALPSTQGDWHLAVYDRDLRPVIPPQSWPDLKSPPIWPDTDMIWTGADAATFQSVYGGEISPLILPENRSELLLAYAARHWHNRADFPPQPLYLRPAAVTLPAA